MPILRGRKLLQYRRERPLDWRDPEMPCFEISRSKGMVMLTPEEKQRLSQRRLQMQIEQEPFLPKGPERRK